MTSKDGGYDRNTREKGIMNGKKRREITGTEREE
jgi:hypothetical protein